MPWNYRLMRIKNRNIITNKDEFYYSIHEVFYDANTPNASFGYTKDPVDVSAYSVEEIKFMLEKMLKCLEKPILDYEEKTSETNNDWHQ